MEIDATTHRNIASFHKLNLALIRFLQELILSSRSNIRLTRRETHRRIVVHGVYGVWQDFLEPGKVHGVGVSIQEQDMIRVDFAHGLLYSGVELLQPHMLRVGRLVHGIIARNLQCLVSHLETRATERHGSYPSVALVVLGKLNPEIDHPVLQILEVPEHSFVDAGIAVPSLILAARESVHIKDGVDAFSSAHVDYPVNQTEAFRLDD